MQKIFDEYGGIIIAIVVVAALILVASFTKGPLNNALSNMISSFNSMATGVVANATTSVGNISGGGSN